MLYFGHSVACALRLNPNALPRLAPVTRRGGTLCFSSGQAAPSQYDGSERKMDRSMGENPSKTQHGDTMRNSFGEGYSTRSDEEGFGGTNAGSQAIGSPSEITHPEYDKSQGSEVKAKEKARNQQHAAS
ncbi:hypothetical protein MUK42_30032 [Musa troglodytarum]|uniref:Late embryogenesis abundant protein n=1 Tax=Musa troglodytarum TaxID=320322 RepID=A0A9E7FG25_9LILI|nr:hypothetical protein MUK42_30032 [Musa troglodytarum]